MGCSDKTVFSKKASKCSSETVLRATPSTKITELALWLTTAHVQPWEVGRRMS